MLVLCVCVCLSVCPAPWDLRNGKSCRRALFAGVKRSSWRVAQTAFWAYTMRGSRGETFGTFQQVTLWSPSTHVTLSGYPGRDESCPPFECCWNPTGTIVDIAFTWTGSWLHNFKNQPFCERVTTSPTLIGALCFFFPLKIATVLCLQDLNA